MQRDYVLDPSGPQPLGPAAPRGYIKISNVFLQSSSIGLSPVKVSESSLNDIEAMVWYYRRTDRWTAGRTWGGYNNIPVFSSKRAEIKSTTMKVPPWNGHITKTYQYNFDPLKPHFYIVKLGFTGVYIIFLISDQNIDCGYSLEPPHRGGSNEYPQPMF